MNNDAVTPPVARRSRRRILAGLGLGLALAFGLGACSGTALPTSLPSVSIPTMPPVGSGTAACVDPATKTVLDQLIASGADVPALLTANKDVLIAGLGGLELTDTTTEAWRDALVSALDSGDMAAAATEIAKLANDEVTITSC